MPEIKNLSDERVLMAFVNKMIEEKGGELEPRQLVRLRVGLRQRLDERIEHAMIDALSDEKLQELDELMGRDCSDDEIEQFFENSGVDYEVAVKGAMRAFRDDYLERGNNEEIIAQAEKEYQEFLATAPEGQGESLWEVPDVPEGAAQGAESVVPEPVREAVEETVEMPVIEGLEGMSEAPVEAVTEGVEAEVAEPVAMPEPEVKPELEALAQVKVEEEPVVEEAEPEGPSEAVLEALAEIDPTVKLPKKEKSVTPVTDAMVREMAAKKNNTKEMQ